MARAVLDDSTARLHAVMDAADDGDSSAALALTGDFTTGLTIGYRHSPLTMPGGEQHRVRPGDRAPDGEGVEPGSGRTIRAHDLLRGPHWTLLAFDQGHPAPAERIDNPLAVAPRTIHVTTDTTATGPGTVLDPGGRLHRIYDIDESTRVLIRPDGYIAARVPARDDPASGQGGMSLHSSAY